MNPDAACLPLVSLGIVKDTTGFVVLTVLGPAAVYTIGPTSGAAKLSCVKSPLVR